ncbi:putative serine incorporator [Quercus suber]|uniref:Serine incorporator n=1 Tax=Quercus suber TaxID=58331 RepID=A0AAW0L8S5_QUESU
MKVSTGAVEAAEVNIRPINSEVVSQEEVSGSLEQKNLVDYSAERKKSLQARYSYGIIFLVTNLIAWFIRDYGQRLLPQLQYLKACGTGGHDCFRTLGVLRTCGNKTNSCTGTFYSSANHDCLLLYLTISTRKLFEVRNTWHSRWWAFKFFLFIVSVAVPFFLSSDFIQLYGEFARIGAGCSLGLFTSTLFYIASICGIVVMYPFYAPRTSCTLNIFFITWTAILLLVMMVVSLHSKVNRGLLSSGIMASYVVFLCWSAIRSEPATEKCYTKEQVNGNGDWTTILSFLMAICAIVMATFSTGIDSQSFQFRKDEVQQEDDIPYKYGFFHLVFSFGAMYFAMLFISWNLNSSARKTIRWSIDVGWASTWVKIVNEWFAATLYCNEPATEKCYTKEQVNGNGDWTTILSFLMAICAIVMATFSTGIDSQSFQFRKDEVQQEDDIPYKYGFFHLVFSFGAMYFAMLFISWNLNSSARKWSIDVGWAIWTLISPVVIQSKVIDRDEPMQQTDESAIP